MKISSIKEIMANEKVQMELENIHTESEFRKFCAKYDFSHFEDTELDETCLGSVFAGVSSGSSANFHKWVSRIIEEYSVR